MIISTIRVKNKRDIFKILDYIESDKGYNQSIDNGIRITKNLRGKNLNNFADQFKENDKFRQKTKAKTVIYHENFSIHPEEAHLVDMAMLEDLTRKYIELRCNNEALAFARSHMSEAHPHVHIAFSGTHYKSTQTLRMDNKTFAKLRIEFETYQKERYPQLTKSLVHLDKVKERKNSREQDKNVRREHEYQAKRNGKILDKDQLKQFLSDAYSRSNSTEEFYNTLLKGKIELYERNGVKTGVVFNNRKFRFKTLGIEKEMLERLNGQEKTAPVKEITNENQPVKEKTTVNEASKRVQTEAETRANRLQSLRETKKQKRKNGRSR